MKSQSVAKGFAILSIAGIFVKVLSLLYIPFLLAIIGDEGYGIYSAAYQVYVFIYVLANSGVPVAISKLVSELIAVGNHKDAVKSFKIARFMLLSIGLLMSMLMFLLAGPLAELLHFSRSTLAIMALSPTLLFTSIASSYRGYFQGTGNMTPTAVSQIIEQVINAIFTVVFAALLMKSGLEKACAGGTIGTSLGAFIAALFLVIFHIRKDRYSVSVPTETTNTKRYMYSQLVKKVINYSVPITLCIGLQYAGSLVDLWNTKSRLLVAGFTDANATELYSHIYKFQQLINAPIAITVALATALLPAVSAAVARRDKAQIKEKVDFAFRACFIVALPSAVAFSVLSSPIFKFLQYGEGAYIMRYGSFLLVLFAVVQIQSSILQGAGRMYTLTFYLVVGIIGKIITNYFLISNPDINIMGSIVGSLVGFGIPIVFNFIVMKRIIGVSVDISAFIKPFISSAIMGVVVFLLSNGLDKLLFFVGNDYVKNAIVLIISGVVGGAVYFLVMALTRGITTKDLEIVPHRFRGYIPKGLIKD